jgi:hypothetical protein
LGWNGPIFPFLSQVSATLFVYRAASWREALLSHISMKTTILKSIEDLNEKKKNSSKSTSQSQIPSLSSQISHAFW